MLIESSSCVLGMHIGDPKARDEADGKLGRRPSVLRTLGPGPFAVTISTFGFRFMMQCTCLPAGTCL
ncbi:hypothetical protein ZHAS_00018596 [Anopheles sinensis]|uniref:Uncharacterized protein n=1 Tax=Anopheles sinensis TaxID=74873 RepID=A0A084WJD3_ANOSI|nr:hypothetical protein ZHAS_00018596 [Anopheles sinensis]